MAGKSSETRQPADLSVGDLTCMQEGYDAPTCEIRGAARSSGRFHPDGFSLWQISAVLESETELEWGTEHGDEALYVRTGELEVNGARAAGGGMIIVEAGVPAVARAIAETAVVHQGPSEPKASADGLFGPPAEDGRCVHVFSAGDAQRIEGISEYIDFFADSTCQTCRIACFIPCFPEERREPGTYVAPSHSHSVDEIFHILDGEMRMGRHRLTAGMSVAIPGGRRYGFRLPKGCRFLNYRCDVGTGTFAPGSQPILETVESIRGRIAELPDRGEAYPTA